MISHIGLTTSISFVLMWPFPLVNPIVLTTYPSPSHHVLHKNMFPIFFQGGTMVSDIMCGDGIWHIDRCPSNSIVQCSTL